MKLSPEDSAWRTAYGDALREAVELRKQLRAAGNPVVAGSVTIRELEKIIHEASRATQRLIEEKFKQLQQGPPTPEYIRLPSRGRDFYFGLSRSFWYDLEKRGTIRLMRIRRPGRLRGVCLIPFGQARDAIQGITRQ